jgi:fatty acid desaturase
MGAHDPRREAYDRARREALRAWEAEDQSEDAAYSGWRLVLRLALYLLIVALGLIGWGGIFWLVLS